MANEVLKAGGTKSATKTAPKRRKPVVEKVVEQQHWTDRYWRIAMAYTYLLICLYDFVIGPVVFNGLQYLNPDNQIGAYQSVTLQSGGFIHMTFGAILGLASHGRNKVLLEKMK